MNITKTKTNGSPEEKGSTILNPHDTAIYIDVIKRNNFCHTYFGAKSTWLTTCPALTRPENPTARAKHTTAYSRSSHDINPVIIRHPPVPKNAMSSKIRLAAVVEHTFFARTVSAAVLQQTRTRLDRCMGRQTRHHYF